MGIWQVILEVDVALVKEALESNTYRLSTMGGVITELKLLREDLNLCNINLCRRECNRVAHALAAIGCKFPSDCKIN